MTTHPTLQRRWSPTPAIKVYQTLQISVSRHICLYKRGNRKFTPDKLVALFLRQKCRFILVNCRFIYLGNFVLYIWGILFYIFDEFRFIYLEMIVSYSGIFRFIYILFMSFCVFRFIYDCLILYSSVSLYIFLFRFICGNSVYKNRFEITYLKFSWHKWT
jgi:hypothetical protein